MSNELPWTGERYIPGLPGNIALEHLHRYDLASKLVYDRRILDIASGEGYGTAMLVKAAGCIGTGIDISQEAVDHAVLKYGGTPLGPIFTQGSCEKIPMPSSLFDVVVSFETLEHHDKHEEFMQEVKRVMQSNGFLIISSPNKRVYSDLPNYKNPFHVKELYLDEFRDLLEKYFEFVDIYGQKLMGGGSVIAPLDAAMADSMYYIAVASNITPRPYLGNSFFSLPTNQ